MAKVKIVQVAIALSETEMQEQYLDDKGRVWYQVRELLTPRESGKEPEYHYVWKQLDLPDEPGNQKAKINKR